MCLCAFAFNACFVGDIEKFVASKVSQEPQIRKLFHFD